MRLIDEEGYAYGVKHINNKPRVSAMPYTYDIAEGNVADHLTWSKIGFHAAISTSELDMMPWAAAGAGFGWTYPFPTSALTMTIVSDSVEDKITTGTGAWTVTVYYLTTAFLEKSATVNMNGNVGSVQIATDIYRIQNARITTAGTAGRAVGNITIASGGQTYGYISSTKTRARQCVWTVPLGKTLYVTNIVFSCAQQEVTKYVRFTTRANFDDKSGLVLQRGLFMPFNEVVLHNTSYSRDLNPPTRLPATTDLKVSAIADAVSIGSCTLRGWVETT
jgi:hypothetical protein